LEEEVAADSEGRPTNDPHRAASLLPTGTYKGYGIASMIEILCGVYTGMAFGRAIPAMYKAPMDQPRNLGQFYMVMRVDGVIDANEFIDRMQQMTDEVRVEPAIEGESVYLPGDIEIIEAEKRMEEGVPLDEATVAGFRELSERFGVPLKLID